MFTMIKNEHNTEKGKCKLKYKQNPCIGVSVYFLFFLLGQFKLGCSALCHTVLSMGTVTPTYVQKNKLSGVSFFISEAKKSWAASE